MEDSKFNFSSITKKQKKAITRIEDIEQEFLYRIEETLSPCAHTDKAKRYLRLAVMQCNAAILFHWEGQ